MTPLAHKVASQLTLPESRRTIDDQAGLLSLISEDLHCFEVTAISKTIDAAMDEENMWNEAGTMLPAMFLPSPVTWLETLTDSGRIAWIAQQEGIGFRISMAIDGPRVFTTKVCEFASAGPLSANPILVKPLTKLTLDPLEELLAKREEPDDPLIKFALPLEDRVKSARAQVALLEFERKIVETSIGRLTELQRFHHRGIVWAILVLDLINTPGLVGIRQHDPHRGLARRLALTRSGSYPLRGWSEIVLKHQTHHAEPTERHTGATFHKCLHFVRSHLRHYQGGKVSVIPAHWRGDPALGIKRSRYRVAA